MRFRARREAGAGATQPLDLALLDGAGDGNRNRMTSLEGWGSTIELRPHDAPGRERRQPSGTDYRLAPPDRTIQVNLSGPEASDD
jgi:hypothetical protein